VARRVVGNPGGPERDLLALRRYLHWVLFRAVIKTASGTPILGIGLSGEGAPVRASTRQMAKAGLLPEVEVLICYGHTVAEVLDEMQVCIAKDGPDD
jgi:hypothetical protein